MSSAIRLSDFFPNLHLPPLQAKLQIDWSAPVDFETVVNILWSLHDQEATQGRDPTVLTDGIVREIFSLKTRYPDHLPVFNLLQLAVCYKMMDRTMISKELPQLWKWTAQSLHHEPVDDRVIGFNPFKHLGDMASLDESFEEDRDHYVGNWLLPFFYSARKNGKPFHDLADHLFPMALNRGVMAMFDATNGKAGVWLLSMAFEWEAGRPGSRRLPDIFSFLHDIYAEELLENEPAYRLGLMFATFVGERRGLNISEEAKTVISRFPSNLIAQDRLQLQCSVALGDLPNIKSYENDFADSIRECRQYLDSLSSFYSTGRRYREGVIFSSLSLLIRSLLNTGEYSYCLNLIRLWKQLPQSQFLNEKVMIVLPERPHGVGYFYGGKKTSLTLRSRNP